MNTVNEQKEVRRPYEAPDFMVIESVSTQMLAQSEWIPYEDEPGEAD